MAKCSACCLFSALSHGQTKTALRCFSGPPKSVPTETFWGEEEPSIKAIQIAFSNFKPLGVGSDDAVTLWKKSVGFLESERFFALLRMTREWCHPENYLLNG